MLMVELIKLRIGQQIHEVLKLDYRDAVVIHHRANPLEQIHGVRRVRYHVMRVDDVKRAVQIPNRRPYPRAHQTRVGVDPIINIPVQVLRGLHPHNRGVTIIIRCIPIQHIPVIARHLAHRLRFPRIVQSVINPPRVRHPAANMLHRQRRRPIGVIAEHQLRINKLRQPQIPLAQPSKAQLILVMRRFQPVRQRYTPQNIIRVHMLPQNIHNLLNTP